MSIPEPVSSISMIANVALELMDMLISRDLESEWQIASIALFKRLIKTC